VGFASAHDGPHWEDEPIKEWHFWPDYTLPGAAKNYPGPRPEPIKPNAPKWDEPEPSFYLGGSLPTEQYDFLLEGAEMPRGSFSIELWVTDHVNRPVGVMASIVDRSNKDARRLSFGYNSGMAFWNAPESDGLALSVEGLARSDRHAKNSPHPAFMRRWHHLMGTWDDGVVKLYHNGVLLKKAAGSEDTLFDPTTAQFSIATYLENEPYMDIGNLLHWAAVYDFAMDEAGVAEKFRQRAVLIEEARVFEDLFHYTAGPYLNAGTENSINLLWETDRPRSALVEWGESLPYDQSKRIEKADRLQVLTLSGLKPDTPYFYRVTSIAGDERIDSGPLTFRTMPEAGAPITFSVIGDTEARPHVNDQVAKQIWGERPHFNVIVGDLTDGGRNNNRFEWTHEYFLGVNQVASRIPFIAAPGNGESDLVWYQHYHNLPNGEYYYSYRVGDIEFFMLDSNMGHHDQNRPGFRAKQKAWLEQALKKSTAKWKFAGHHHPVYSSDENDYGDTYKEKSANGDVRVRDDFLELYEKYGVDMVFFGHLHSYERTWPIKNGRVDRNGVVYVQTGGAGGNLEAASPTRNWFTKRVYSGHHYVLVHVEGDTLELVSVDTEGRERDRYELVR